MAPTTHSIANTAQYEVWNGAEGEHWAEHHERYAAMSRGGTDRLLAAAAPKPDARVLDVGCGVGRSTLLAAELAQQGHATGIDLSARMVRRARAVAATEGRTNATFTQGDAQVHPFEGGAYDTVISQAGVMFFDDPVAAFRNLGASLAPGGRLAFLCHRAPDEQESETRDAEDVDPCRRMPDLFAAMAAHVPISPALEEEAPGVADFADPEQISAVLSKAGFGSVAIEPISTDSLLGADAEDAATFLCEGSLSAFLAGADETAARRARDGVRDRLLPYETDRGVLIPAPGWQVTALWPGYADTSAT